VPTLVVDKCGADDQLFLKALRGTACASAILCTVLRLIQRSAQPRAAIEEKYPAAPNVIGVIVGR
jgi:hypothetical protein